MIPIVDLHTDLVLAYFDFGDPKLSGVVKKQMTLSKLKPGGVGVVFGGFGYDGHFGRGDDQLAVYEQMVKEEKLELVLAAGDLESFGSKTKLVMHIEGGGEIENVDRLEKYIEKGVRSIGLTHNHRNSLACGVSDGEETGLTELGKEVVRMADKRGIMVDLAHINGAGFKEIAGMLTTPLVVSHTTCRAICDQPRGISDEQIKMVAASGGVVGVFFSGKFVADKKEVGMQDVIAHFVHVAKLVGAKHVAIGSDFGGITSGVPKGLEHAGKLQDLLTALEKAGFSREEVEGIAYRNALRVLKEILDVR